MYFFFADTFGTDDISDLVIFTALPEDWLAAFPSFLCVLDSTFKMIMRSERRREGRREDVENQSAIEATGDEIGRDRREELKPDNKQRPITKGSVE